MEEHPQHWRDTLMGWDFWQDAKQYEDRISKELDIALDLDLPRRFPFNLVPEETPTKRQRRLSMSDAAKPGLQRHSSLSKGVSRFRAFERRARSPSPRKIAPPINPLTSGSSAPVSPSPLGLGRSSLFKQPDLPPGIIVKTREVSPSPGPPLSRQPPPIEDDFATAEKPFVRFRGGSTWSDLPRTKKSLGLDLFWPCMDKEHEPVFLDIVELQPLCEFRTLRSLKLTGMSQSYQKYIWQAAWLNLDLEDLSLEMALEPKIDSMLHASHWKPIKDGWEMDSKHSAEPVYHGQLGDGELHPRIGHGEYLDKQCIEKAKILAFTMGRTSKYLSVKHLTLSGFVVDADPFVHWFDPKKLQSIKFKGQCLDAGLWLPESMKNVIVRYPRKIELEPVAVGMVSVDAQKELKVMDVQDGAVIGQSSFPASEEETRALPAGRESLGIVLDSTILTSCYKATTTL